MYKIYRDVYSVGSPKNKINNIDNNNNDNNDRWLEGNLFDFSPSCVRLSHFQDLLQFPLGVGACYKQVSIILFLKRSVSIPYTDFSDTLPRPSFTVGNWSAVAPLIAKTLFAQRSWQDVFCPRIRYEARASRMCRYEQIGLTSARI